ncbi:Arc family DNA-binding protein [Burkholderia glumae]|uniref:Arc family DNA-binding protein n=2 Tax=Burkholderia glumae TaxID=337 RepID=UPI0025553241|nr:Arc family DNA-binding protein [Burkholderia glumae]
MKNARTAQKFLLRMDYELKDQLQAVADRQERSLNGQIIVALRCWLEQDQKNSGRTPMKADSITTPAS